MAKGSSEYAWTPRVTEVHVVKSAQNGVEGKRKRSVSPTPAEIAQLRRNVTRAYRSASPLTGEQITALARAMITSGEW